MKNHILIRETLDWRRAGYADLRDDAIRTAARIWDASFGISWLDCRARIKEAAQDFLRAIPDARIIGVADAATVCLEEDDLLLVADDDDWYHPAIFEVLRRQVDFGRHAALVWPDGVFGYHVRWQPQAGEDKIEAHLAAAKLRPLDDPRAYSAIKTNNYALTRRLAPGVLSQSLDLFLGHTAAAQTLSAKLQAGDGTVAVLDRFLSLANRHPCSYLVLVEGLGGNDGRAMARLVDGYVSGLAHAQPQAEVAWAVPHLAAMRAIFREVAASVRI